MLMVNRLLVALLMGILLGNLTSTESIHIGSWVLGASQIIGLQIALVFFYIGTGDILRGN